MKRPDAFSFFYLALAVSIASPASADDAQMNGQVGATYRISFDDIFNPDSYKPTLTGDSSIGYSYNGSDGNAGFSVHANVECDRDIFDESCWKTSLTGDSSLGYRYNGGVGGAGVSLHANVKFDNGGFEKLQGELDGDASTGPLKLHDSASFSLAPDGSSFSLSEGTVNGYRPSEIPQKITDTFNTTLGYVNQASTEFDRMLDLNNPDGLVALLGGSSAFYLWRQGDSGQVQGDVNTALQQYQLGQKNVAADRAKQADVDARDWKYESALFEAARKNLKDTPCDSSFEAPLEASFPTQLKLMDQTSELLSSPRDGSARLGDSEFNLMGK